MTLDPILVPIPPGPGPRTPAQVQRQKDYARLALRHCADMCGAPRDGWEKNADEVPLPQRGYYWSVSHKRNWAAAVLADEPVGIDIEHVRTPKVFKELAGDDEWELMGDRSPQSFFKLWTAKEAVLKATGIGIAGFSTCRLLDVPDDKHAKLKYEGHEWSVEHYYHADHVAAVTVVGAPVRWHVLDNATDFIVPETSED